MKIRRVHNVINEEVLKRTDEKPPPVEAQLTPGRNTLTEHDLEHRNLVQTILEGAA